MSGSGTARNAARVGLTALAVLSYAGTGCGGPSCKSVAAMRARMSGERPRVRAPHASIAVSYATANALIADAAPSVPPVPIGVPGALRLVVVDLDVAATGVRLHPRGFDRVVATVDLALRHDGDPLLTMTVDAELEPRIDLADDGAWLTVGFGPDNITSVRPVLPPEAAAVLGDALYALIPDAARSRVPRLAVTAAASSIVSSLADRTYTMLRSTLLARVGEVTALRVPLGDVPVEGVRLRSLLADEPTLVVDLHTELPTRAGVGPATAPETPGAAAIRIAGSTAAELGNWAMTRDLVPNRFDRKLEPTADGDYQVVLDWRPEHPRPLVVHVFRERDRCAYVRVGARPVVSLADGRIGATVTERVTETVRGSAATKLYLWVRKLVGYATRYRRIASSASVRIGDRRVEASVARAAFDGDDIVVEARVSLAPAGAVQSAVDEADHRGRRSPGRSPAAPSPVRQRQGQDRPRGPDRAAPALEARPAGPRLGHHAHQGRRR